MVWVSVSVMAKILQKRLELSEHLFGCKRELIRCDGDLLEEWAKGFLPLFDAEGGLGRWIDTHALPADEFDDAVSFEEGVGFGNGHGVDLEFLRDLADGGEELALLDFSGGDKGVQLINELAVKGDAGAG